MAGAKEKRASMRGTYCCNPNCGWWIEQDEPHSYAIGALAGHYCFGCEPAGHQCTTVNAVVRNYGPQGKEIDSANQPQRN